ncbi:hypothetical protein KY332_01565 [Candidatus Woesearchaeota archaeon]|nr:hypothetical protein [Candidatus Woesearchaeota archaeon]
MRKKGQITLFIILGIVLLLGIGLFLYLRQATTVFTPERVVPPELKPIDTFVSDCINNIATDGVNILGANGGFIRFPDEISSDQRSYLGGSPLFPSIKVPLWHFRGQTRYPSEDYMKEDLAHYIDQNLDECLSNLEPFQNQFTIQELAPRAITVDLTDESVKVTLDYPLEFTSKAEQKVTRINQFVGDVPVRLKTVYELAKEIVLQELDDKFLEERTIDLIALDPRVPYTDMEFTCSPKIWYVDDVEARIKDLLHYNLPSIRIEKTDYLDIPDTRPYVQNHYIWTVTDLNYRNTHVNLNYDPTWPIELQIRPNQGTFLKSNAQRSADLMSFLCIHMWHFTYDVKYPVMVTITDDAARNHNQYTFNFAFEVSINHNEPDKTSFGITEFDFQQRASSEEFCAEEATTLIKVRSWENVSTPDINFYEELPGVNISFTCIRFNCPMGVTERKFHGIEDAFIQELFPVCVNGVVRGTKQGYEENFVFATTDKEKTVDIYLTPTILKDITFVKHKAFLDSDLVRQEESLDDDQSVIITIKRKGLQSSAIYPSEEEILSQLKFHAKWDYEYEIEAYLADDRGIYGGYMGKWTPAWNDLRRAKQIKFHVVEFPFSRDEEKQLQYLTNIEKKSKLVPTPELIR